MQGKERGDEEELLIKPLSLLRLINIATNRCNGLAFDWH